MIEKKAKVARAVSKNDTNHFTVNRRSFDFKPRPAAKIGPPTTPKKKKSVVIPPLVLKEPTAESEYGLDQSLNIKIVEDNLEVSDSNKPIRSIEKKSYKGNG